MLPYLIEAQPTRFVLGVATTRPKRREVIVAIDEHGSVEVGVPSEIRRADERVKRERGRPVAARESIDDGADSRGFLRGRHGAVGGFFGGSGTIEVGRGGAGVVPGAPTAVRRAVVLSDFGSMKTPKTESTVVTEATFRSANAIVMSLAITWLIAGRRSALSLGAMW